MKVYQGVRGTQEQVPQVEVNKDTVYIRSNMERIEEEDFTGWQYDETQYNKNEYIEKLSSDEDIGMIAMLLSMVMAELDTVKQLLGGDK